MLKNMRPVDMTPEEREEVEKEAEEAGPGSQVSRSLPELCS